MNTSVTKKMENFIWKDILNLVLII